MMAGLRRHLVNIVSNIAKDFRGDPYSSHYILSYLTDVCLYVTAKYRLNQEHEAFRSVNMSGGPLT